MIVPDNFDTNIDSLIDLINNETIFLSNWDTSKNELEFPDEIIEKALTESKRYKNCYAFSDEMDEFKPFYYSNLSDNNSSEKIKKISIVSNGTTSTMLTLYSLKEKLGKLKVLLITPIYYTYIKILMKMNVEIHYIQVDLNNISLPIIEIRKLISQKGINLLILNDPLFGMGISIKKHEYLELSGICNDLNCYFLIDYINGGLEWYEHTKTSNEFLVDISFNNKYIVFIESLCKRVFLNGIKNAVIIANEELSYTIEKNSVYLVGSIAYLQAIMFKQLYLYENKNVTISIINKNIAFCSRNYDIINNLLLLSNIKLLECNSGCFCLIGIPIKSQNQNSTEMSKEIFDKTNVLLIPHDRYLLFSDEYYYFRINLLLKQDYLINGIIKLKDIFDN